MYVIKGSALRISVRNLVEFLCRGGDIDAGSGLGTDVTAMQEGARIHRLIQHRMGAKYHAEVPLKYKCDYDEYSISIEGRADGIICDMDEDEDGNKTPVSDVIIDEIKTMQTDVTKMKEAVYVHKAQAMCYAYIYATQHNLEKITVQMTYCNSETEEIKRFAEDFSYDEINKWYENLMKQFKKWTDFIFEQRQLRQESIGNLEFPFEYREGQRELVVSVYKTINRGKTLYIQAPTGVGKTIATIFPAVAAMGQNKADKIFYLTSKTITRTVAENTYVLLRENGLHFRTVTLTARDKICMAEKRECNPANCEYAKGHFDRVNDAIFDAISNNEVIDRTCIEKYALKHRVCPFEMSLDIASCFGYVVFAGLVSGMGTTIFAAHSIAVTAETIFYISGYGLRTATSTLIGISLGEEDEKQMEAVASVSVKLTMILMCVSGVILFFVARPLMGLLTESSRVVEIGAGMLRIVAFSEPFYGLMIVTEGIFYGLGKTKYAFYVETFCMWGIRILFTFFCVKIWHFGLETVWYCMIADNVCKAVLFSVPLVVKRKRSCLTKLG